MSPEYPFDKCELYKCPLQKLLDEVRTRQIKATVNGAYANHAEGAEVGPAQKDAIASESRKRAWESTLAEFNRTRKCPDCPLPDRPIG